MPTPVEEALMSARIRMLLNMPFFGNLAVRLKLIDASNWCDTAGTDGKHFYYNKEFILGLNKKELEFLFGHEVMHCVYDHMERRGSRDPNLWNIAADHVINLELVESSCGELIHHPGKIEPCYDEKYRDMTSDQVYELLKEESDKNKSKMQKHQFDMHMDPADGNGDGEGDDDGSGEHGPISMSDDERSVMKDEIQNAVREAAKVAGAGNCPGGVKRMIKDLTDPQMDWRELLNATVQSCQKADYTFARPNRKSSGMGGGIILPGMDNEYKVSVVCAIDTSGSIGDKMIMGVLGEIRGIMDQFDDFNLKVFCFDTDTYKMWNFSPENIEDIHDFETEGHGGTRFQAFWQRLKDDEIEPDQLVVMTDMYPCDSFAGSDPDNASYCPTFWLAHSGGYGNSYPMPDFGTVIEYIESK